MIETWAAWHEDVLKKQRPWAVHVKVAMIGTKPRRSDHGQSLGVVQVGESPSQQHPNRSSQACQIQVYGLHSHGSSHVPALLSGPWKPVAFHSEGDLNFR